MCGIIGSSKISPGTKLNVITSQGNKDLIWGFQDGQIYNSRFEKVDSIWKDYNHGILETDCFWENGKKIYLINNLKMKLGILHDNNCFSIVTINPIGLVKDLHNRMPLILSDLSINNWISKDNDHLLLVNEKKLLAA